MVAILAVLALLLGVSGVAMAAPRPPTQRAGCRGPAHLVGPASNPRVGETFQVQVAVKDVTGLAGYQVELNYDNALVHAVSVTGNGGFLNPPVVLTAPR